MLRISKEIFRSIQSFAYLVKRKNVSTLKSLDEIPEKKSTIGQQIRLVIDLIPVIGRFTQKPLRLNDVFKDDVKKLGPIFRVKFLGGKKSIFISDPQDIQKVFEHEGKRPKSKMFSALKMYRRDKSDVFASEGNLLGSGPDWYKVRLNAQRTMLNLNIVEKYLNNISTVSNDFVERIKLIRDDEGEIPNFLNEIFKFNLESLGFIIFNYRLGCFEDNLSKNSDTTKFINAFIITFQCLHETDFGFQVWRVWPQISKSYRKLVRAQDLMSSIIMKHVNIVKHNMKDKDEIGIVEMTLKSGLSLKETMTFLVDIFLAGLHTTSNVIASLLYLLARYPEAQEKLYSELKTLTPITTNITSRKTLHQFQYLNGCIKETIRLMPVLNGTNRILDHDIDLSGYSIPAGTHIIILNQMTALDEKHFEDAESFKPERWFPEEKKAKPFAFIPFGAGGRSCIGQRIAMQEIQLLMIKIFQVFRVEYHYEDIKMKTQFIETLDKPLRLRFIERR